MFGLNTINEKHVFVVGGSRNYYRPFEKFGKYTHDINFLLGTKSEVHNRIALVLFTGGEDVSPSLYGEPAGRRTSFNAERDKNEVFAFMIAKAYNLPMAGVCRGAQLLCVMAGGKLVQHLENHLGHHPVKLWNGKTINMSSTHHQMQLPPADAQIIGWMENPKSSMYLNGNDKRIDVEKEVEVVYYPSINAVGMQYHPEFLDDHSEGFRFASEVVEEFLLKKEKMELVA